MSREIIDRLFLELSEVRSEGTQTALEHFAAEKIQELRDTIERLETHIESLRQAAIPLCDSIQDVATDTQWRDGDETDRVYSIGEFKALIAAIAIGTGNEIDSE